jgi:hypothetical protein
MTIESADEAKAVNAEVDTVTITTATADAVDATAATATTDLDLDLARDSAVEAIENADAIVRAPARGLATDAISATAEITVSCCNIFRFFFLTSLLLNKNRNCLKTTVFDARAPPRRRRTRAIDTQRYVLSLARPVVFIREFRRRPVTRIESIVSTKPVVMLQEKVKGLIPTPFAARRSGDGRRRLRLSHTDR